MTERASHMTNYWIMEEMFSYLGEQWIPLDNDHLYIESMKTTDYPVELKKQVAQLGPPIVPTEIYSTLY